MKKNGFTLVEVIAIIIVIAAVMAIAGVNIFKFRDNANKKALQNIIDNIEKTTELYIESNSNDIVYKCENGESSCICDNFREIKEDTYECVISVRYLVENDIYNSTDDATSCSIINPLDSEDCLDDATSCSIINPLDSEDCLDDRDVSITIYMKSNSAIAEITEK